MVHVEASLLKRVGEISRLDMNEENDASLDPNEKSIKKFRSEILTLYIMIVVTRVLFD